MCASAAKARSIRLLLDRASGRPHDARYQTACPDNRTMATESSQTLSRGLKLLGVIAAGREGVPVRNLATEMALPRSVVQRLLYTLAAEGFLERHPSNVGYRLTIKLWLL